MEKMPKFKTEEEAAKFWETHSFKNYYIDTKEAGINFIRKPKKTVAVRLDRTILNRCEKNC